MFYDLKDQEGWKYWHLFPVAPEGIWASAFMKLEKEQGGAQTPKPNRSFGKKKT